MQRVSALLRALSSAEPVGARTTDLAAATELPRATAHRLLVDLRAEGLVDRDDHDGTWHLGAECFLLGTAAAPRFDVTPLARVAVRRLALQTGESAFFSVRRGDESICLVREDGSFPIRSHVLHEGIRFPLGVASAGIVLLAFAADADRESYLARCDLTDEYGAQHASPLIRERVEAARRLGYALNPGLIVEGSWGMGAAVFSSRGEAQWALSITGIEARIAPPRQEQLGQMLLREAHALTEQMAGARSSGR